MLSEPRYLMKPFVSLSGTKYSWIEAIIQEQCRWESMPNRQGPVTVKMVLQNRKSEWAQEHHTGHKG
eukprot:9298294-Ditylum_brightwellii.AAC.1